MAQNNRQCINNDKADCANTIPSYRTPALKKKKRFLPKWRVKLEF